MLPVYITHHQANGDSVEKRWVGHKPETQQSLLQETHTKRPEMKKQKKTLTNRSDLLRGDFPKTFLKNKMYSWMPRRRFCFMFSPGRHTPIAILFALPSLFLLPLFLVINLSCTGAFCPVHGIFQPSFNHEVKCREHLCMCLPNEEWSNPQLFLPPPVS